MGAQKTYQQCARGTARGLPIIAGRGNTLIKQLCGTAYVQAEGQADEPTLVRDVKPATAGALPTFFRLNPQSSYAQSSALPFAPFLSWRGCRNRGRSSLNLPAI